MEVSLSLLSPEDRGDNSVSHATTSTNPGVLLITAPTQLAGDTEASGSGSWLVSYCSCCRTHNWPPTSVPIWERLATTSWPLNAGPRDPNPATTLQSCSAFQLHRLLLRVPCGEASLRFLCGKYTSEFGYHIVWETKPTFAASTGRYSPSYYSPVSLACDFSTPPCEHQPIHSNEVQNWPIHRNAR
ncbi:hypothetical protein VTI28DRAFT_8353 [Corynascus sepedonium]